MSRGEELARQKGIRIENPRFGASKAEYFFDAERRTITKGLSSIKNMGKSTGDALFLLAHKQKYQTFLELLAEIRLERAANTREMDILIHVDFFRDFGNQRELDRLMSIYEWIGEVKTIKREEVDGTAFEPVLRPFLKGTRKDGSQAARYTILVEYRTEMLRALEKMVRDAAMPDYGLIARFNGFERAMGFPGFASGRQGDRRKLAVRSIHPIQRKRDGKQIGYSVVARSIGSGIETRYTVWNRVFDKDPLAEGDFIVCTGYSREGSYFTLESYRKFYPEDKDDISAEPVQRSEPEYIPAILI